MQTPKPESGRLAKIVGWTIGVVLVPIFVVVGFNTFDEDLSPEAKALLVAPPNPYRAEDNLYLALAGFEGPRGARLVGAGEDRVAAHDRDMAAALKNPRHQFADPTDQEHKLKFRGEIDFCAPLSASCVEDVEDHRAEIAALLRDNRELMARYLSLHGFRGYYDTSIPGPHFPSPYVPVPVRELYLANIALQAKAGGPARQKAALADLQGDIRTWRSMLVGSGSLVSKMVAVANLHGDHAVLADVIAERRFGAEGLSRQVTAALDELGDDDWKIGSAAAHEYRAVSFLWEQQRVAMGRPTNRTEENPWWERLLEVKSPFFQLNAIQNLQARDAAQRKRMADVPPKDFLAARDAYRRWLADNAEFGLHYVYNPMGKVLVSVGAGEYADYSLRAYDCAAFVRLVRLGHEIRSQRIERGAIPEFMRRHPEWSTHPVDGRTFLWNERKHEIVVQTLAKQPRDRRFSISVWRSDG